VLLLAATLDSIMVVSFKAPPPEIYMYTPPPKPARSHTHVQMSGLLLWCTVPFLKPAWLDNLTTAEKHVPSAILLLAVTLDSIMMVLVAALPPLMFMQTPPPPPSSARPHAGYVFV
jgi:hypothetical protein